MEKLKVDEFLKLDKKDLAGKVICFPTDTVYGIGALFNDQIGIKKIYEMKNRPLDKPLANLCSRIDQILDLGIEISSNVRDLIDQYWPGALTIIFGYKNEKISFRMPNCDVALKIIDKFSIMTTTSVNESGQKELNSYEEINEYFKDKIDYFITDEVTLSKVASTVIDVSDGNIKVLRQGTIKI
jgi:L-threonylcarbamoyladenylate synthase